VREAEQRLDNFPDDISNQISTNEVPLRPINMKSLTLLFAALVVVNAAPRNPPPVTCVPQGMIKDCSCKANLNTDLFHQSYQLNDFRTDCTDPNNAPCFSGGKDPACSLYAHIIDKAKVVAQGNLVIDSTTLSSKYDHTVLSQDQSKWLVLPGSYKKPAGVTGVEDVRRDEGTIYTTWALRPFAAAVAKANNPTINAQSIYQTFGLAINPSTSRSRHQMHLHLGRVKKDIVSQLQPTMTTLTKINGAYGIKYAYAIYTTGEPKAVFAQASSLMDTPAKAAGAVDGSVLNHHSILVVPSSGTGYYLVIGWDQHMEAAICQHDDMMKNIPECAY
jgi:hypothetical protein